MRMPVEEPRASAGSSDEYQDQDQDQDEVKLQINEPAIGHAA